MIATTVMQPAAAKPKRADTVVPIQCMNTELKKECEAYTKNPVGMMCLRKNPQSANLPAVGANDHMKAAVNTNSAWYDGSPDTLSQSSPGIVQDFFFLFCRHFLAV